MINVNLKIGEYEVIHILTFKEYMEKNNYRVIREIEKEWIYQDGYIFDGVTNQYYHIGILNYPIGVIKE